MTGVGGAFCAFRAAIECIPTASVYIHIAFSINFNLYLVMGLLCEAAWNMTQDMLDRAIFELCFECLFERINLELEHHPAVL